MFSDVPHADPVLEARRVLDAAASAGVALKAIGGVAIRLRANGDFPAALAREYGDIDLVTPKGRSGAVTELLGQLGYLAEQRFNALHGSRRLIFVDAQHDRHVDVFVGTFEMCHTLALTARMDLEPMTVPAAELLLTKLQIVELNLKDVGDASALLLVEPLRRDDDDGINAGLIARLCAADWGLWRTCTQNLERLAHQSGSLGLDGGSVATLNERIAELQSIIAAEPRSSRWRLRDRIGDRKRWFEEPEETR